MIFGGPYSLELVAQIYFWFSSDSGKNVDILDVDKGPCEVVSLLDAFEAGCLCGQTGDAMEISNASSMLVRS